MASLDGMTAPRPGSAAAARLAGITPGRRRGIGFTALAHDLRLPLPDALDERERLAVLATLLPDDAAWGGPTAAWLWGAPVDRPHRAHVVLTPRPVLPRRPEFVVHERALLTTDTTVLHGLRVTAPAQTFLDLAPTLTPDRLLAVGDALCRPRAGRAPVDAADLVARIARAARARGVRRARQVAPHVDGRAGSPQESRMRWWLIDSELPDPELQVPVRDGRGVPLLHGDLGYERWKLLMEYEGRQHAAADQFGRDIDRYSLTAADGYLVLRFAEHHVRGPWVVVDRTRRALISRGWRPAPC